MRKKAIGVGVHGHMADRSQIVDYYRVRLVMDPSKLWTQRGFTYLDLTTEETLWLITELVGAHGDVKGLEGGEQVMRAQKQEKEG